MGVLQQRDIGTLLVLVVASGGFACRSKLEVKTVGSGRTSSACSFATAAKPIDEASCAPLQSEPTTTGTDDEQTPPSETPPEPPIPQEMSDMLVTSTPKIYFQSRDVITLHVPVQMIDGGDSYRLLNITREEAGEEPLILVDEVITSDTQTLRSAYLRDERRALVRKGDYYVFAFYPGSDLWQGRFFYGLNRLKLEVDDVEQPRFSILEFTLRDFEIFGMAITAFPNNVQVATSNGVQFQGWVNVLSPPISEVKDANGKVVSKLVHGMFNMINPH